VSNTSRKRALLAVLVVLTLAIPVLNPSMAGHALPTTAKSTDLTSHSVWEKLSQDGWAIVSIVLKEPDDNGNIMKRIQLTQSMQRPLVDRLLASGADVVDEFWLVNMIVANVTAASLSSIASEGDLVSIQLRAQYAAPQPVAVKEPYLHYSGPTIGADIMHSLGYTGAGINVAVIDTGIENNNRYLMRGGASVVKAQYDATHTGVIDYVASHGTHVAGIIASQDPYYTGIAPGANLYDVIVFADLGGGSIGAYDSWIIDGMQWALKGPDGVAGTFDDAKVLSLSLGSYYVPNDGLDILSQACDNAVNFGANVVVAAGDGGPGASSISAPGTARKVITVGAEDDRNTVSPADDLLADFSSRGPSAYGRVDPDVLAPGVDIVSCIPGGGLAAWSGTSMATPHVSGAVALLLQAFPSWGPDMIKAALMNSAKPLDTLTMQQVPHPYLEGAGLINVYRAYLNKVFIAAQDPETSQNGPLLNMYVKPAQARVFNLIFTNSGPSSRSLSLGSTTFYTTLGAQSVSSPISFSASSVNLAAYSSVSVSANISVPGAQAPGMYAGYIVITDGVDTWRVPVSVDIPMVFTRNNTMQWTASFTGRTDAFDYIYYDFEVPSGSIFDLASLSAWLPGGAGRLIIINSDGALASYSYVITSSPTLVQGRTTGGVWHLVVDSWYYQPGYPISFTGTISLFSLGSASTYYDNSIAILQTSLALAQADISLLQTRVDAINGTLSGLTSQFLLVTGNLQTQVDGLRSDLNKANDMLSLVKTNLTTLSDKASQLRADVDDVVGKTAALRTDLSAIQGTLSTARATIDVLGQRASSLEESARSQATLNIALLAVAAVGVGIGAIAFNRTRKAGKTSHSVT